VSTFKRPSEQEIKEVLVETFAKLLLNLFTDPRFIATLNAFIPADVVAADYPVIAQQFVANGAFNLIQSQAKQVLASKTELPADARHFLEENLVNFHSSLHGLASAIEPLRGIERKFLSSAYENITGLMLASAALGMSIKYSEEARANFQNMRAAAAQKGNQSKASTRKQENLVPAILKASEGMELVGSSKFAESIHEATCRFAGVKPTSRGYSPRTIQREIGAMLKERRES
jgi:hypothetical protein